MLQKGNEFMITKMTNRMICNTASKFVPMKYNLDLIFDLVAKKQKVGKKCDNCSNVSNMYLLGNFDSHFLVCFLYSC